MSQRSCPHISEEGWSGFGDICVSTSVVGSPRYAGVSAFEPNFDLGMSVRLIRSGHPSQGLSKCHAAVPSSEETHHWVGSH